MKMHIQSFASRPIKLSASQGDIWDGNDKGRCESWYHPDGKKCVGKMRRVRFIHHDGGSGALCELGWYGRLAEIEYEKRFSDKNPAFTNHRLKMIEPVTVAQAKKEGWFE